MINVIICGANGAMGVNLIELINNSSIFNISAEINDESSFSSSISGDVIIDFSHYSMMPNLLDFIESTGIPAVICTTGLSETLESRIKLISSKSPIFRSQNMSLGINLLISIAKKLYETLQDSFDIEIIEMHHNKKIDSPSGTALMIANEMNRSFNDEKKLICGRSGNDFKRDKNEIGIHSIRGGSIVGEHHVVFAGENEIIKIEHIATSKKIFAEGALKAASYIIEKENGLYSMEDII